MVEEQRERRDESPATNAKLAEARERFAT